MSIEAMKQALEALEDERDKYHEYGDEDGAPENVYEAITALRQAIEQAEKQEPVAWQVHPFDYGIGHEGAYAMTSRIEQVEMWKRKGWTVQPLYTAPPAAQRQWVGLTDEEVDKAWRSVDYTVPWEQHRIDIARAIEAKLKEKNL
jgi:hypothetical protein